MLIKQDSNEWFDRWMMAFTGLYCIFIIAFAFVFAKVNRRKDMVPEGKDAALGALVATPIMVGLYLLINRVVNKRYAARQAAYTARDEAYASLRV